MRKLIILSLLVAVSCVPAMAAFTGGAFKWNGNDLNTNLKVKLLDYSGGISGGEGGAFVVDVVSGSMPQGDLFTTYCVEKNITFHTSRTYWATIDKVAYSGSSGASGDVISTKTEAIYDKWLAEAAAAASPSDISQARQDAYSQAIWYAEDEIAGMSSDAQTIYDSVGGDKTTDATSTYALNLWDGFTELNDGTWVANDRQSHLTKIPAPGAILLGSLGTVLVGYLKRRRSL